MKDVFKYARNVRPGDVDQDGRRVSDVRVILVYDHGPMLTVPADDIRTVAIQHDSGVEGSMLAHLSRAELAPLPGSQAAEALKRLARLQALIEAAASWTG